MRCSVLAARGWPELLVDSVLVGEMNQDRERFEEALIPVDQRRHLAVRIDRDEFRPQVLLLLRIDLDVLVRQE